MDCGPNAPASSKPEPQRPRGLPPVGSRIGVASFGTHDPSIPRPCRVARGPAAAQHPWPSPSTVVRGSHGGYSETSGRPLDHPVVPSVLVPGALGPDLFSPEGSKRMGQTAPEQSAHPPSRGPCRRSPFRVVVALSSSGSGRLGMGARTSPTARAHPAHADAGRPAFPAGSLTRSNAGEEDRGREIRTPAIPLGRHAARGLGLRNSCRSDAVSVGPSGLHR